MTDPLYLYPPLYSTAGTVAPEVPPPTLNALSKSKSIIITSSKLSGGGDTKKRGSGRRGSDAESQQKVQSVTSVTKVDTASVAELSKVRGPAFSKFLGRLLGKAVRGLAYKD